MQELGLANHERSIVVVREKLQREAVECNFLFKKSGFTDAEVRTIEDFEPRECLRNTLHTTHATDNPFTRLITAEDPEEAFIVTMSTMWLHPATTARSSFTP